MTRRHTDTTSTANREFVFTRFFDALRELVWKAWTDPTRWPVLVTKVKNLGRDFRGYSAAELRSIKAQVLIMMGDRDGVRPEHAVER